MKAIQVKYLPATNSKPSRWKAWIYGGLSVTASYDYDLDEYENAKKVACLLVNKMDRNYPLIGGGSLPNQDYVFTLGAA